MYYQCFLFLLSSCIGNFFGAASGKYCFKVSFENEFGVVLDKTADNDLVGLIRWDAEKENDVEDWRGLFGSFLQAGGEIVSQDYNFKFIDDKGQLKEANN